MPDISLEKTLDLSNTLDVIDIFNNAAKANLESKFRSGSVVNLPHEGGLLMTGDIHDNYRNYCKIIKLARLNESKQNHLILHELIHGEHLINGKDLSIRLLAKAAALKLNYPDQVHQILSNHELTQVSDNSIIKRGINVVDAFKDGIKMLYDSHCEQIIKAMKKFVYSLPLAVHCANGIFCSHSLPSPRKIDKFDTTIINRSIETCDYIKDGAAHMMVWGRRHNQQIIDKLSKDWGAKIFILGHQHAEMGYFTEGDAILVISSEHNHGQALPIDLSAPAPARDKLIDQLIPLAGIF